MKIKKRYSKQSPLLEVDYPKLNCLYHVSFSGHGVVGRCVEIDHENKTVVLKRPKSKTNFKYPVKFSELRHTRRMQTKILSNKNK